MVRLGMYQLFCPKASGASTPEGMEHSVAVRLLDAAGAASSAGLLQVSLGAGSFGSVCGANAAAADVICRQAGMPRPHLCIMSRGVLVCVERL